MKKLSLRKQAQLAPKYVLQTDDDLLFVAAEQGLIGCNLTNDINEAMQFSIGFDNEALKLGYYNATIRRINSNLSFKVKYI